MSGAVFTVHAEKAPLVNQKCAVCREIVHPGEEAILNISGTKRSYLAHECCVRHTYGFERL